MSKLFSRLWFSERICRIFGHKWYQIDNEGTFVNDFICLRCADAKPKLRTISEEDAEFFRKLSAKYLDIKVEMQEIANILMELYTDISDTAEPKVYGSVLGIHERIELFLAAADSGDEEEDNE